MLRLDPSTPLPYRQGYQQGLHSEAAASNGAELALLFLRRRRWALVIFPLLAMLLGGLYAYLTPPTYVASTSIVIDGPQGQFVQQQSALGDAPVDFDSQIELLKSDQVASEVVRELGLDQVAEFYRPGGIRSLLSELWSKAPDLSDAQRVENAIATVQYNTKIDRAGTVLLTLNFTARERDRAVQVANALAQAFVARQVELKSKERKSADNWLLDRATELRKKAVDAEQEVLAFRKAHDLIPVAGKLQSDEALSSIGAQLAAAHQKTLDLTARLNRLKSIGVDDDASDITALAASLDLAGDALIVKLREQSLDYNQQIAEMSRKYGQDYWAVGNLKSKAQDTNRSLREEIRRVVDGYRTDLASAKQTEHALEVEKQNSTEQSESVNEAMVKLKELESTAQNYRALSESYVQHSTASLQTESYPVPEGHIINAASLAPDKNILKKALIVALAIFAGIGAGVAFGLFRDVRDVSFRTKRQIESRLDLTCIAMVPLMRPVSPRVGALYADSRPPEASARTIARGRQVFWSVIDNPNTRFSEEIYSIKLALDLSTLKTRRRRIIGITSALPNEGKSTISASLSALIAQLGGRGILVDLDLRNPALTRMIARNPGRGVVDVILGRSQLDDVIWREPSSNLHFLPASGDVTIAHSAEFLASGPMRALMDRLSQLYDYVIVDLPPLAPIVDVRVTAQFIDNYVLVVEWGRTGADVVERALETVPNIRDSLLGVAMTKVNVDQLSKYDAQTRSYYTNPDFARYGYSG